MAHSLFPYYLLFLSLSLLSFSLTPQQYVCIYIYKQSKVGDLNRGFNGMFPFQYSIATTHSLWAGRYSIPWIIPLYPWPLPYNAECLARWHQVRFFSLWYDFTRSWTPGPWPLAYTHHHTHTTIYIYIYIYIYIIVSGRERSCRPSVSYITSGRLSRLHPESV